MGNTDTRQFHVREGIIRAISEDIRDAYTGDDRAWVVGFSGGKDSTALLQILYYAIGGLPAGRRCKRVYVLASDTRVETPRISARVRSELESIQSASARDGLPITCHLVYPRLNDTFWVNLIGRGYPPPTARFRWCTDRLKIYPVSKFIGEVVSRTGDVVVVLGGRKAESATRAQTMCRHRIGGSRFRPHTDLPKAWVYTPIEDLTTNEVWTYLLNVPSPWNGDNRELVTLYRQASGECPLVIDSSTPACGHSRFGCWTCTVVDRDRSMESLVEAGEDRLEPLLRLRDYLKEVRSAPGARYDVRRNGRRPRRRGTGQVMTNTGPLRHSARVEILRRVLMAQNESGITLIEGDELAIIQEIWSREENTLPHKPRLSADAVRGVWKQVFEEGTMPADGDSYAYLDDEDRLLKEVCEEQGVPFEMMRQLREIEEQYGHLRRRHGLPEEMREVVKAYCSDREE